MFERKQTLARKAVEPAGTAREHLLMDHLPYLSVAREDAIMLRDGDVMGAFLVRGVAAATAEQSRIDDVASAVGSILAQSMPDVAFYVHRFSYAAEPDMRPVPGEGLAAELDARWQGALASADLRERTTMISVVVRPQRLGGLWARLTGGATRDYRALRAKRLERLDEVMDYLMQAVAAAGPERLTVRDGRWLGLLKVMTTGKYAPLTPGASFTPLADLLGESRVDFRGDTFAVPGLDSADMRFGAMFTLKSYPTETETGVLDRLDLSADTVVAHSFTPMEMVPALSRVQRTSRQMGAADDAARSARDALDAAADDLASGRIAFGNHQLSVMVTTRSEAELDDVAARVRTAIQRTQGVPVREGIGARSAFFAQHPGNYGYRARAAMISSSCFADFAALHGAGHGLAPGTEPWGDPVTMLPNASGELYRFNFHEAGRPGDRTPGHTLVVGRTGSGKSLSTAFLIAQAQRVRPRVIVFDKDRGLETPVRRLGGSYSPVRMGEPTGFNPFRAEADPRGAAWLTDWLGALLSGEGAGPLSPLQSEALANAVAANAHAEPGLQTLKHFRSQLLSVDDGGDLHTRMAPWDRGGQYDWLFSGTGADPLAFDNPVTGFDLSEVLDSPALRTAWLSYVFRRIERAVEDGEPTLIVLDEAWKLLDDAYFQTRLKDWMLTMRKKNAAIVMLTQRVSHIFESRAGGAILESTATQLLFPNPATVAGELDPLGVTENEAEFLTSSPAGGRLALIRGDQTSEIVDMDLSALGPFLGALGGGPRAVDDREADHKEAG